VAEGEVLLDAVFVGAVDHSGAAQAAADVVHVVQAGKETERLQGFLVDITERKRFERDLRDSEEKLRNLFERVRHGLFISSKEGKFLDCNQALLDMLG
jgi:PAS domain-containing protein